MIYSFAVSFGLGIIFEKIFGFGWSTAALIFLVSLILSFYFKRQNFLEGEHFQKPDILGNTFLVIGIALAIGILRMSLIDVSPDSKLSQQVGRQISFEGIVHDEADVRDASARYVVKDNSKNLILLVADRYPQLKYGDQIKVSGKLDIPKNFENATGAQFDYVSYLAKDKIHFLIYRPQIEKIGEGGNKILSWLYSIKYLFLEKISEAVPEPNSSFLGGVIFGVKQSLGENILSDFQKAGLIHIVVLSGYNITIIAAGIFMVTSWFGKRNWGFLVSSVAVVLFAVMVGLGATVIRAVIMALIAILAKFLGRPADALRWLFIAGIMMLIWNPLIIFYDPSFQLSFLATLGLILWSQPIENLITTSKLQKFITPKFKTREIVSSTLAVQLFVLPILVKMSGFVSIVSFIVNPIILPLVPWTMGFGALTGAFGLVPVLGKVLSWPFGVVSYFLSQVIISITQFAASIPLAVLPTGSLSISIILIWYLAYGVLYYKLISPRQSVNY